MNRTKGQLDAFAEELDTGEESYRVIQLLASNLGALSMLMSGLVEGVIQRPVIRASNSREAAEAWDELCQIIKSFWR